MHKKLNEREEDETEDKVEEKSSAAGQRPKGFLYKGTPFLRGNAEDKAKIQELRVSIQND